MDGENVLSSVVGSLINRNKDEFSGCNGIWILLLLYMFSGGMWGANHFGNTATTQDVAVGNMFNQIDNGIRAIERSVSDNGYATLDQFGKTNMAIQGTGANLSKAISESVFVTKDVGCGINRNIDGAKFDVTRNIDNVKYDVTRNIDALRNDTALQTCSINEHADRNQREVLAAITDLKMSAKDDLIAELRTQLAGANQTLAQGQQTNLLRDEQTKAMQTIIATLKQPCPVPAYLVGNPNCGCGGAGYGYGYGGTAIV